MAGGFEVEEALEKVKEGRGGRLVVLRGAGEFRDCAVMCGRLQDWGRQYNARVWLWSSGLA